MSEFNLPERAMLVSLSLSVWTARKHDRKASAEVAVAHNASYNAGRYNKNLLPGDARAYKTVQSSAVALRLFHYKNTLPWMDEGVRILPVPNYFKYMEGIRSLKYRFEEAVEAFLMEYGSLRDAAENLLGSLYNPLDYPKDITEKFGARVSILPFPAAGDFRVQLSDGELDYIRKQITEETNTSLSNATRSLFDRLYETVEKMADKLGDPEAIFHSSLLGNAREICELLPLLNLEENADLTAKVEEVKATLLQYEAQDLRDDVRLRNNVAEEARRIQKEMAQFFNV